MAIVTQSCRWVWFNFPTITFSDTKFSTVSVPTAWLTSRQGRLPDNSISRRGQLFGSPLYIRQIYKINMPSVGAEIRIQNLFGLPVVINISLQFVSPSHAHFSATSIPRIANFKTKCKVYLFFKVYVKYDICDKTISSPCDSFYRYYLMTVYFEYERWILSLFDKLELCGQGTLASDSRGV